MFTPSLQVRLCYPSGFWAGWMCYCLKQPVHKGNHDSQWDMVLSPQVCGTAGGGLQRLVCISFLPRGRACLWCISSVLAAVPSLKVPVCAHCSANPKGWVRIPVCSLTGFQHAKQTAKLWCMSKLPMGRDRSSRRRQNHGSTLLWNLALHQMLVPDCATMCVHF